jgi:hypothetical protein
LGHTSAEQKSTEGRAIPCFVPEGWVAGVSILANLRYREAKDEEIEMVRLEQRTAGLLFLGSLGVRFLGDASHDAVCLVSPSVLCVYG